MAREPNRNRKPELSEPFFQEPKPEPSLSVKTVVKQKKKKTFQRGTVGTKNRNREPSHARTVTEPNRTGATLLLAKEPVSM